jgi:hypothetical protein
LPCSLSRSTPSPRSAGARRWHAGKRRSTSVLDTRTPEELLDLIEAKGREIAEAIALLRRG